MMIHRKKGQAAMEFLMTYGWAILAAIIVIAALAAFGVFSPSTYIPNTCSLSAPLGCVAGNVNTSGVYMEVRNGAGDTITLTSLNVTGCTGTVSPALGSLTDQQVVIYNIGCTPSAGTKFRGDVSIIYTKAGSSLPQTSTGEIVDEV